MNKKYIVRLTDEERTICAATIKNEKGKSEKLRRATILLKADADGPTWNDTKISEAVGCRTRTVENVRQAFVCEGFERALVRKKPAITPFLMFFLRFAPGRIKFAANGMPSTHAASPPTRKAESTVPTTV